MQVAALVVIGVLHRAGSPSFAAADLICVPAGLFGTHIGMGCYRGLSNRQFGIAVNLLLIISGLSFVV